MSQLIPGFDIENTNQSVRKENQQEQVNRSVLSKTLRILSLPNGDKNGISVVLDRFPKTVVKYERQDDPHPLTWVKMAGANDSIINLKEMVFRRQTDQVSDLKNLSCILYLRKKIRFYCIENKLMVQEIVVKNSFMMIRTGLGQEPQKYKSTELAVLLRWQYDDWHGTPIKKLLTTTELKNMEVTFKFLSCCIRDTSV
ncbi:hypothetical protein GCK32_009635 [Trichostrongylus colubriformis]|uniref:Uncharacterized protein n=1 Tax=Trichostrongylus colubriformis TaxID=6319 RepID=A0AAN8EZV0_TRICO